MTEHLRPGISVAEIDGYVRDFLATRNASAAPLHYGGISGGLFKPATSKFGRVICSTFDGAVGVIRRWLVPWFPACPFCGFPGHACISVNAGVCHGVPTEYRLQTGDVVKLDIAVEKDSFIGDTCATFLVGGKGSPQVLRLIRVTHEALFLGILAAKVNGTVGDIGHAVQAHAEAE